MTTPFSQILADYIILNGNYTKREVIPIVIGFLGVLIFIKPDLFFFSPKTSISNSFTYAIGYERIAYIVLILVALSFNSFSNTIYKKLKHVDAILFTFYTAMAGFFMGNLAFNVTGYEP